MKIILLNAPPRAGKDTLARYLCRKLKAQGIPAQQLEFSAQVKTATHAALNLTYPNGRPLPHDHFEQSKDLPCPSFFFKTPRQAYIDHAEKYMKPLYGDDIFAKLAMRSLTEGVINIFSDCGFIAEAKQAIARAGVENCLLIEIHRKGCNFDLDSRSYIGEELLTNYPMMMRKRIFNNFTQDYFLHAGLTHFNAWYHGQQTK